MKKFSTLIIISMISFSLLFSACGSNSRRDRKIAKNKIEKKLKVKKIKKGVKELNKLKKN